MVVSNFWPSPLLPPRPPLGATVGPRAPTRRLRLSSGVSPPLTGSVHPLPACARRSPPPAHMWPAQLRPPRQSTCALQACRISPFLCRISCLLRKSSDRVLWGFSDIRSAERSHQILWRRKQLFISTVKDQSHL